jgi:hypothetical protein
MFDYLFICGPFNDVVSSPEYIASKCGVTNERTIGKCGKRGHDLNSVDIPHIIWRGKGKPLKISVHIIGYGEEI